VPSGDFWVEVVVAVVAITSGVVTVALFVDNLKRKNRGK